MDPTPPSPDEWSLGTFGSAAKPESLEVTIGPKDVMTTRAPFSTQGSFSLTGQETAGTAASATGYERTEVTEYRVNPPDDLSTPQEVADKQESSTYGQISVYRMPDRVKITDLYSIDVSNATGELEILVEFKHQSRKVTIDLEKALERLIEKATIPEDLANLYYTPEELEKAKKDDIGRIAKLRFFANDEAYETSRRHQKDMVVWTVSLGFYTNAVPSRLTYGFDVFRAELRPGRVVESRSGNIHKRKRAGPTLWITNCLKNPIVHVESSSSSLDHVEGEYLKILSHFRKTNPDKPFQTQKRKHAPDKTLSPPPAPKSRPRLKLIVPPHGKSL